PLNNQKITSKHPRKSANLLINHFFLEPLSGNELRILQHLNPLSTTSRNFLVPFFLISGDGRCS
ncbi:MAG: hypothetical protein LWW92_17990, partial [Rhodocyclales bacterium]|nr:hypothetical protein [Rhodocyclales bacterium]